MLSRRFASTARRSVDHGHYDLHAWPKTKQPSPNEIFNMYSHPANRSEFEKDIKATYQKFVKLYHPDVCALHDIMENGKVLLVEQKRQRFDQVQNAYEILKSPSSSNAYKKYENTTWADYQRGKTGSFDAYRMANAHRQKYSYQNDPKFWHAATWEDYYQMRYGRPAPTREEFEKNKWKILWRILAVAAVVTTLQVMLAMERSLEFNRQMRLTNLRSNANLEEAYSNYDEGHSRFQRIRRFLLYRRLGLEGREHEEVKQEENDMLTKYAQQQVTKFENTDGMKLD